MTRHETTEPGAGRDGEDHAARQLIVRFHNKDYKMEGKRPAGLSALSVMLGWLALSGEIIFWISHNEIISILALFYGASALVAAFGLWKIKPWAFNAYLVWCGIVVLMMISMQLGAAFRTNLYMFIVFAIFVLALLSIAGLYINKTVKRLIEHRPPVDAASPRT